jgi:carotenoid cleavage dioxygenase-like enzyme
MDGISSFLGGNYAPVRSEDDFDLVVTGQIPAAIRGALYLNGPNPQFEPRGDYHWFVGDGMIHCFFVEDGKVRYRNRYVRTPKYELENAAGKALFPQVEGDSSGHQDDLVGQVSAA